MDYLETAGLKSSAADHAATTPTGLTFQPLANLAEVMAFVAGAVSLTTTQRRQQLCALRVLARTVGKDPRLISVAPDDIRILFASVVPAARGLTDSRWRGIRSRTVTSLRQAGVPVMPGRSTTPLSFTWAKLADAVPSRQMKIGLSRFMRFCTNRRIEPQDVDQAVFDRFRLTLQSESVVKATQRVYRVACDQWNKAGKTVAGWPATRIKLPQNDRVYSYEWSEFAENFVQDVEAFFSRATKPSPFVEDYLRPVSPATIKLQRAQIRQMSSLLVQTGTPIESITSLSILVEPDTARKILVAAHERLGDGAPHLHGMALLLKGIGANWCKVAPEAVERLKRFANGAAPPKQSGMTPKNRERLRQFDSLENLHALLELPRDTFRKLEKQKAPDRKAALLALQALAVEFLIAMPMRIKNLTALDFNRHIVSIGLSRKQVMHVVIPEHEIKNEQPYEVAIPADTVAMLQTYRKKYLPLVCDTPTTLLFPNDRGTQRHESCFSTSITRFVRRDAGLIMNVHLFRHFAVTLYLKNHPDDVETARRLMGHKNISTTLRFYADIKNAAAFRRYEQVVANLRPRITPERKR